VAADADTLAGPAVAITDAAPRTRHIAARRNLGIRGVAKIL
jgi:hypothetical protein